MDCRLPKTFEAVLWSYWGLTGKPINKIIKICLVGTSEQPEVSLRRRGYYPGNRRTSTCYGRSTSKNQYPRFPDDSGGDHYGGAGWPILPLTGPTYLDGWTSTPLQALALLAVVVSDRAAHFMPLTSGLRVFMVGGVMGLCPQSLFLFRQNIQFGDHYFCVLLL